MLYATTVLRTNGRRDQNSEMFLRIFCIKYFFVAHIGRNEAQLTEFQKILRIVKRELEIKHFFSRNVKNVKKNLEKPIILFEVKEIKNRKFYKFTNIYFQKLKNIFYIPVFYAQRYQIELMQNTFKQLLFFFILSYLSKINLSIQKITLLFFYIE